MKFIVNSISIEGTLANTEGTATLTIPSPFEKLTPRQIKTVRQMLAEFGTEYITDWEVKW